MHTPNMSEKKHRLYFPRGNNNQGPLNNNKNQNGKQVILKQNYFPQHPTEIKALQQKISHIQTIQKTINNLAKATDQDMKDLQEFLATAFKEVTISQDKESITINSQSYPITLTKGTALTTDFIQTLATDISKLTPKGFKNWILANNHTGSGQIFRAVMTAGVQHELNRIAVQASECNTKTSQDTQNLNAKIAILQKINGTTTICNEFFDTLTRYLKAPTNNALKKNIQTQYGDLKTHIEKHNLKEYFPGYETWLPKDILKPVERPSVEKPQQVIDQVQIQKVSLQETYNTLQKELQKIQNDGQDIQDQQETINGLRSNLNTFQQQVLSQIESYNKSIATSEENATKTKASIDQLRQEMKDVSSIGTHLNTFSQAIKNGKAKIDELLRQTFIVNIVALIPQRSTLMVALYKEHAHILQKNISLLDKENPLIQIIQKLLDNIKKPTFSVEDLYHPSKDTNKISLQEVAQDYEDQQKKINTKFNKLLADYSALQPSGNNIELETDIQNFYTQKETLNTKIEKFNNQNSELTTEKNKLNEEITTYNNEVDRHQTLITQAQKDIKTYNEAVKKYNQRAKKIHQLSQEIETQFIDNDKRVLMLAKAKKSQEKTIQSIKTLYEGINATTKQVNKNVVRENSVRMPKPPIYTQKSTAEMKNSPHPKIAHHNIPITNLDPQQPQKNLDYTPETFVPLDGLSTELEKLKDQFQPVDNSDLYNGTLPDTIGPNKEPISSNLNPLGVILSNTPNQFPITLKQYRDALNKSKGKQNVNGSGSFNLKTKIFEMYTLGMQVGEKIYGKGDVPQYPQDTQSTNTQDPEFVREKKQSPKKKLRNRKKQVKKSEKNPENLLTKNFKDILGNSPSNSNTSTTSNDQLSTQHTQRGDPYDQDNPPTPRLNNWVSQKDLEIARSFFPQKT